MNLFALAVFVAKRFRRRAYFRPLAFLFLRTGLAFGPLGASLMALAEAGAIGRPPAIPFA